MVQGAEARSIGSSTPAIEDRSASVRVRPLVTLHYAQSLDGRIATRGGRNQWIGGEASTRFAHELRAASGAVIIGSGTALADDPLLTVRHVAGKQPLRVVLDGRGRLPLTARVVSDVTTKTIVATSRGGRIAPHVERWEVGPGERGEGVDLAAVLVRLHERGIEDVLVEGGGRVLTSFFRAGLVDRLIVAIAPIVLGAGVEAVGDLEVERIEHAKRFVTRRVFRLGEDAMVELEARRD